VSYGTGEIRSQHQLLAHEGGAAAEQPLVLIVDDDERIRTALQELMMSVGIDSACFASTRELLDSDVPDRPGCIILDVRMPGSSGLDFQNHLATKRDSKPVIFLIGHGDIPMTVRAMKAGAVDFLTKPVRDQTLLDAVATAIAKDISLREAARIVKQHVERLATLTPRERQIFRDVVRGQVNKQIAFDLGISEVTVKLHRGNVMRKMAATSVAQLVRAWETLPEYLREAA
jgi:FixJ family two-component response regulator